MGELDEAVREFLAESRENLERLDTEMVALEERPHDRETLDSVFRTIHTIKGTCGFLGFQKLEAVTHAGENLLASLRSGRQSMSERSTSALLGLVDAVRAMLGTIATKGREGAEDYAALVAQLEALQGEGSASPTDALAETRIAPRPQTRAPDATVRVDVGLLDRLMNLVGELVLARNQLLQRGLTTSDPLLSATKQRLDAVTTSLQESVMKTRMQPIANVFRPFPRLVRDLARQCEKQVRLELEGQETELDRTLLEAIKDPLTHILRNCVDHGIESPEMRMAAGKDPTGTIRVRAAHEGGQVIVRIEDDGGGIDPQRVAAKAIERGLIQADAAKRMSARELTELVFLPGFSTASSVSSISGRGVGMDVVKTNLEKAGGTVELESQPGLGTRLELCIPLTLAILPALIVRAHGERYAIPQSSLVELLRSSGAGIEQVCGTPVLRLRGRLLPLVSLARELALDESHGTCSRELSIAILRSNTALFGLVVEAIEDVEEIVAKPLVRAVQALELYAGATIMGDGRVALILDVGALAARAQLASIPALAAAQDPEQALQSLSAERGQLLVCRVGAARRVAVPLCEVVRLEEFARERVEGCARGRVVQYDGRILPLVYLAERLGERADEDGPDAPGRLQVIVWAGACGPQGLVVDEILDVVAPAAALDPAHARAGVLGSAVLAGQVTDLLDVPTLARGDA